MTDAAPDPRTTPARADLAARHLADHVTAQAYADGETRRVTAPQTNLLRRPDGGLDTQLLFGEDFTVYDVSDGWAWGQSALDGYVGYVREADLDTPTSEPTPRPTHRVATLGTQIYAEPELKRLPLFDLPFGARLSVLEETETHARIGPEAWVPRPQIAPLTAPAPDFIAVARMFLGVPYVWGGRSSRGLDCSGLLQLALQAAGQPCPRDSDMQADALGQTLTPNTGPKRGDLIFWRGHVGMLSAPDTLLHANAHHMAVAEEPLDGAIARIGRAEFGAVTRRARLDLPEHSQ